MKSTGGKIADVCIVAQQHIGIEKQIVEVHRTGYSASVAIGFEYLGCVGALCVCVGLHQFAVGGIIFRRVQVVLANDMSEATFDGV